MGRKQSKAPLSPAAKLEKKLRDTAGDEVVDSIQSEGEKELKARLFRLDVHEKEVEDKMAEDDAIEDLKTELKNAKAPYTEPLASIKLQRRFIVTRLKQQGKA